MYQVQLHPDIVVIGHDQIQRGEILLVFVLDDLLPIMNSTSLLKVLLLYEKTMREESGLTFIKVPIMENIGGEMMEGVLFIL